MAVHFRSRSQPCCIGNLFDMFVWRVVSQRTPGADGPRGSHPTTDVMPLFEKRVPDDRIMPVKQFIAACEEIRQR
jgi:hypothetical protein